MPRPTNDIAGNGSHGELVRCAPAPATATNLATDFRVATTELLGNLVQSTDVREFANKKQYCQSIRQLSRRAMKTKKQTRKLTGKKRLYIVRKVIRPRVAAGQIAAAQLREVFKASLHPAPTKMPSKQLPSTKASPHPAPTKPTSTPPSIEQLPASLKSFPSPPSPTTLAMSKLFDIIAQKAPEEREKYYSSLISQSTSLLGTSQPKISATEVPTSHPPIDSKAYHHYKPSIVYGKRKRFTIDLSSSRVGDAAYQSARRQKKKLKQAYFSIGNLEQRRYTLSEFLKEKEVWDEARSVIGADTFDGMSTNLTAVGAHILQSIREILATIFCVH